MEELIKAIAEVQASFTEFNTLVEKPDNKSKQRKARVLSVKIDKQLKNFRVKSTAVDKIPE